MFKSVLGICLALGSIAALAHWAMPVPAPEKGLETVRAMARALEEDPRLNPLTQRVVASEENSHEQYAGLLVQHLEGRTEHQMIVKLLDLRHRGPEGDLELSEKLKSELAQDPENAISALHSAYLKLPASEFSEERTFLLHLADELYQLSTETKEESGQALKEMLVDIIETSSAQGVSMATLNKYLSLEKDNLQKQKVMTQYLETHPDPAIKGDLEKMLEGASVEDEGVINPI